MGIAKHGMMLALSMALQTHPVFSEMQEQTCQTALSLLRLMAWMERTAALPAKMVPRIKQMGPAVTY
jgi:hypothetical protein